MRRLLLPAAVLLAIALIVGDRVRFTPAAPAPVAAPAAAVAAGGSPGGTAAPAPEPAESAAGTGTPTVDLYARLAARRLLARQGASTYLDSLLATSDSVVRRWPDRGRTPVRLAIVPSELAGFRPEMVGFVREAVERWNRAGTGLTLEVAGDTAGADIAVGWVDRLANDRVGQTELRWTQNGEVTRADVHLALRNRDGDPLPDPILRAVALHEIGHALGMPHSASAADAMFPESRAADLSDRDVRTVLLLYLLPPGSVRGVEGPVAP